MIQQDTTMHSMEDVPMARCSNGMDYKSTFYILTIIDSYTYVLKRYSLIFYPLLPAAVLFEREGMHVHPMHCLSFCIPSIHDSRSSIMILILYPPSIHIHASWFLSFIYSYIHPSWLVSSSCPISLLCHVALAVDVDDQDLNNDGNNWGLMASSHLEIQELELEAASKK